ncbi:MAG: hypothetical protein M1417_00855, partial [Candidatus Thermoplasmatota archaeon]|nr:hypothetical protein [Candidatus Thermoplasmatota archaeon]
MSYFLTQAALLTVNTETSFLVALLIAAVVLVGYLEYSVAKGRLMKRKSARMAISLARDKAYNSTVTSRAISRIYRRTCPL